MDVAEKQKLIQQQIEEANDGRPANFELWRSRTEIVLRRVIGEMNPQYVKFSALRYSPAMWTSDSPASVFDDSRRSGVKQAIAILQAAEFEIGMTVGTVPQSIEDATEVFIVHGRSNTKHELARFIEQLLGTKPTILDEQANSGRTVLEKFEDHAGRAKFAVVVATADDIGRAATESNDQPRARQNVVFELGYFFGQLGRSRVAMLYDPGIELPSDIAGLVTIPLDQAGAWKAQIAKEASATGLTVNWEALA